MGFSKPFVPPHRWEGINQGRVPAAVPAGEKGSGRAGGAPGIPAPLLHVPGVFAEGAVVALTSSQLLGLFEHSSPRAKGQRKKRLEPKWEESGGKKMYLSERSQRNGGGILLWIAFVGNLALNQVVYGLGVCWHGREPAGSASLATSW